MSTEGVSTNLLNLLDEEIVISGISGRFPDADNIDQLRDNLFNHVDMISEDDRRWPPGLYNLPTRHGKIFDLSQFDAQFFHVSPKQANYMDPQMRIFLEQTYEAIVDAGFNPQTLRGSKTGVYVGTSSAEVEDAHGQEMRDASQYILTGVVRSMIANRCSFAFDFKGPSSAVDTACSSSMFALYQAVLAMRTGQCDQAIVGGYSLCLRPSTSVLFQNYNMLSADGACRHLDADATGYVRSETCAVMFLQRRSSARRIYATVLNCNTNNDGQKEEGITFPSCTAQRDLMQQTADEVGANVLDVEFVEAHGTGTIVGDPVETKAIAAVFCQGRAGPLLIGSVKSNLGHSEAGSGMCSMAKALITMQAKCIPANLHYNSPNPSIPELANSVVKPVTENTPYMDGLIGVNSFGFGGVNVHAILKPFTKEWPDAKRCLVDSPVPRLVCATGRVEEAVGNMFHFIKHNPDKADAEFLSLLHEVSQTYDNSGMNYRGYLLLDPTSMQPDSTEWKHLDQVVSMIGEKRPVWFVYAGMGSQWSAMAKGMMSIKLFCDSIHKSAEILRPFNVDLLHMLLSEESNALESTVAPFVAIAAVQIALTDILNELGIVPDGIVGHSVGELGCAYGDGVLTHEQMLLSAYWRGKCVEEGRLPRGLMAAVGLSLDEVNTRCPPGVFVACNNSEDSVTISGSEEAITTFVDQLVKENIFARIVKTGNVAYHCPHILPVASALREKLEAIIPKPVLRSHKWISSSVPESGWNTDAAKYSAPEYYVNNLTSQVLFHDALKHVPSNALIIEIAPHSLLQSIIKRTLGSNIAYINLMSRENNAGNVNQFFTSIGKLYNLGVNPKIGCLYPRVEYPVSRGVQSLSPLVKWDHSQSYLVTKYPEYFRNPNASIKIDIEEEDYKYLADHCIEGRVLFPATGYLYLAYTMLCKVKGAKDELAVQFENVSFYQATILKKDTPAVLNIKFIEHTGQFAINEGENILVTGRIFVPEESNFLLQDMLPKYSDDDGPKSLLASDDIYKELRIRGYDYGPIFRQIQQINDDMKSAQIKYFHWVVFLDNMLQMGLVAKRGGLYLPVRIGSLKYDPRMQREALTKDQELNGAIFTVGVDPKMNAIFAPGVEICGLQARAAPKRLKVQAPLLERSVFEPYESGKVLSKTMYNRVKTYADMSSRLAYKLAQQMKLSNIKAIFHNYSADNQDERLLDQYVNDENEQYALLRHLKQLLTELEDRQSTESPQESKSLELDKDLLATVYESQYLLRNVIEVALENMASHNVNVVEINCTARSVEDVFKEYVKASCFRVTIKYMCLDLVAPDSNNNSPVMELDENSADILLFKDGHFFGGKGLPNNLDYDQVLSQAKTCLKHNGFLIAIFRTIVTPAEQVLYQLNEIDRHEMQYFEQFQLKVAKETSLKLIATRSDSLTSTVLLYRINKSNESADTIAAKQSVMHIEHNHKYEWVDELKAKMAEHQEKPLGENIWLLGMDHPSNGLIGMVKCLRQETGGDRIRCILNSSFPPGSELPKFSFDVPIYRSILHSDLLINVYRDGKFGSIRHYELEPEMDRIKTEYAYLNVAKIGDLSSFRWYQSPLERWAPLPASMKADADIGEQSLCTVYYAALNFRDVMTATGKLPVDAVSEESTYFGQNECILGFEFAGRDETGRRVMGVAKNKALATTALCESNKILLEIPNHWSMEEAATVPVVYSTVYYALLIRGRLMEGESVLIHSGSGGVGQAAISVCLSMGCKVYTTVGSDEKRAYLQQVFPQLTDDCFANSRCTSFEKHILHQTDGRGVDVVLNSLALDKLQASVRCLAHGGRFLEIGKFDLAINSQLGMAAFLKNIEFHGIIVDSYLSSCDPNSPRAKDQLDKLQQLMKDGIKDGVVKPLNRTVFNSDQCEEAFRYMASGKHMGKVLIKIRDEEEEHETETNQCIKPTKVVKDALAQTVLDPVKSYIIAGGLGGFGLVLARWLVDKGAKNLVLSSRRKPEELYHKWCLLQFEMQKVNCTVANDDITELAGAEELVRKAEALGPVGGIFNLAMVLSDGFIDGQTAEAFAEVCAPKVLGTENLDTVSRKRCPQLDYFVGFSSVSCGRGNIAQANYGYANSSLERICEQRRADGLHGLAIQWGPIGDVGVLFKNEEFRNDRVIGGALPQRIYSCFAVLDQFLPTQNAVCSSLVLANQLAGLDKGQSILDYVSRVFGIKDIYTIPPSTSLVELGMDSLMAVEVKQILENEYEVVLSMQELRSLTIQNLKDIENKQYTKGQSSQQQESKDKQTIVIPTEITTSLNTVQEGTPIYFIPSIENNFKMMQQFADQIDVAPVVGLNWTRDLAGVTELREASAHFIEYLSGSILDGNNTLNLIGYSFGAVLAFDIAVRMQQQNPRLKINLIFLDASPANSAQFAELYKKTTDAPDDDSRLIEAIVAIILKYVSAKCIHR